MLAISADGIADILKKRTIPGAEQRLCEDLKWAGLQWDEGTFISQELSIYGGKMLKPTQDLSLVVHTGHINRYDITAPF